MMSTRTYFGKSFLVRFWPPVSFCFKYHSFSYPYLYLLLSSILLIFFLLYFFLILSASRNVNISSYAYISPPHFSSYLLLFSSFSPPFFIFLPSTHISPFIFLPSFSSMVFLPCPLLLLLLYPFHSHFPSYKLSSHLSVFLPSVFQVSFPFPLIVF